MQKVDDQDKLVRLSKVPAVVERLTGDRVHIATIHRWALRGVKGVRLQTSFAGGTRRSTERWVMEFFDNVTKAVDGIRKDGINKGTSLRHEAAERELSAEGI